MAVGLIALWSGRTAEIIVIAVFGALTMYAVSMGAFFRLRRKEPLLARPFRTPLVPLVPAVALVLSIGCLAALFWYNPVLGLVYLGAAGRGCGLVPRRGPPGAGPMNARSANHSDVLDELRKSGAEKVKVAVTDIDGILRGKYLHKDKFLSAAEGGFGFCNVVFGWDSGDVCYDNAAYTGWHTGLPRRAWPASTSPPTARVPWDGDVPFFLGRLRGRAGRAARRLPAPAPEGRAGPRGGGRLHARSAASSSSGSTSRRRRSRWPPRATPTPTPLTPGHVRLLAGAHGAEPAVLHRAHGRAARLRRPHRGAAHRDRARASSRRRSSSRDALEAADRGVLFKTAAKEIGQRFGIMPTLHGQVEQPAPRLQRPHPPEPVVGREERLLRREGPAAA